MRRQSIKLGTFYYPPAPKTGGTVFGAHVAVDDFVPAWVQHGTFDSLRLFALPNAQVQAEGAFKALVGRLPRSRDVELHSSLSLLDGLNDFGITVWHDIN